MANCLWPLNLLKQVLLLGCWGLSVCDWVDNWGITEESFPLISSQKAQLQLFQNADYGGLKGYEVFILYSRFNNFKKINMKKMRKKERETCEFPERLFILDLTNSVRIQLKGMLIKEPFPTPKTIVEHYFRLTCHKRRMVSSPLSFIPCAWDVLIFLVFPQNNICAFLIVWKSYQL